MLPNYAAPCLCIMLNGLAIFLMDCQAFTAVAAQRSFVEPTVNRMCHLQANTEFK